MRTQEGLTLLETVVAIAICSLVLVALATTAVSSLRESRSGNSKIQATQVLDTIGRRIAGGDDDALLPSEDTPVTLTAAQLGSLTDIALTDVMDMTVQITNEGDFEIGDTTLFRYQVEVCYGSSGGRRCVTGQTLGRQGVS